MGIWDMQKASAIIKRIGDPNASPVLDALGVQFGLPTCLLDMAKEVLSVFPSPLLNHFHAGIQAGQDKADEVFKDITRAIFLDTGIIEYDTNLGRFVFVSSSSNKGVEGNMIEGLEMMESMGAILGFGSRAFLIATNIKGQLDSIKACIDKIGSFNALQKGPSVLAHKYVGFKDGKINYPPPHPPAKAASLVFEQNKGQLEHAVNFAARCASSMGMIEEITACRLENPAACPEPCFDGDLLVPGVPQRLPDGSIVTPETPLSDILSGTPFCVKHDIVRDIDGNPLIPQPSPGFNPFTDILTATGLLPPAAREGQFLFSKTGIYYDAYGGGGGVDLEKHYGDGCISNIVSAVYFEEDYGPKGAGDIRVVPRAGLGVPQNSMRWLFKYNPNLGGKGTCLSLKDFNTWAETVFDLDIINESEEMGAFYDEDHFLQVLINQRNREIYDVSGHITQLIEGGYTPDSFAVTNKRQSLDSIISTHKSKIDRRKKQIEVHVVLSDKPIEYGKVPINDFKNLDAAKIAIQKRLQTNLIFNSNEVSGIVLPLCPTFIKSELAQDIFSLEDLMVPEIGTGSIITTASSVSSTSGTLLSLTDKISTVGLVAIYNFLDTDLVLPDSEEYLSINCATTAASDKATQLVASSIDSMFPSGVGIPYFRGVCDLFSGIDGNPKKTAHGSPVFSSSPYRPYGYGRIKSGNDDLDSLFYKNTGCTFETWCYVPDLDIKDDSGGGLGWNKDTELSALHRVILGCENRGGVFSSTNEDWMVGPQSAKGEVVKGLLIGFTRDRRLAQEEGLAPSNDPDKNKVADGCVFYMAPTQSINTSGVTFVGASASNPALCVEGEVSPVSGYYGIKMDCSSVAGTKSGKFGEVSSGFRLLTITVDYVADVVSLYFNGDLMKTQSIFATFGDTGPPNLPSIVDPSSFSYKNIYEDLLPTHPPRFPPETLGATDFWYWDGPDLDAARTPFIIGGGYTDGMFPRDFLDRGQNRKDIPTTTEGFNFMGGKWGGKKSGLYGFLGSLKLYTRPLTAAQVLTNYTGQRGFFENIRI